MKLWTTQSLKIQAMLKNSNRYKVLDNYTDGLTPKFDVDPLTKKVHRTFDRIKAKTVDIMDKKTRQRWVFSRQDFNRAKHALAGF